MSNKAIVYASSADQAKMLLSLTSGRENEIILIAPENLPDADKLGADMVYLYPADNSVASLPGAIKELAEKEQPDLVLCEGGADGILVAGFAAVALGTSPLCDVNSLTLSPDGVEASRIVYGGSAAAVVSSPFPAVAVVSAGACEAEIPSRSAKLYQLSPVDGALIPCAVESASPAKAVNLGAAKVVVGVGRGISSADNLPLAEIPALLETLIQNDTEAEKCIDSDVKATDKKLEVIAGLLTKAKTDSLRRELRR